jgi:AcrR family transcriptional regulator
VIYGAGVNEDLRKPPRQARSAATVDRILDSAEWLLHSQGVAETTTIDIAAHAGISVGRLYYWFPDKDAVIRAVIQRAERLVGEFLPQSVVDDPDRPTPDLVGSIIGSLASFVRSHPGALAVLQQHPSIGEPGRDLYRMFVELAAAIVAERVPTIKPDERELVATTCVRISLTLLDEHVRRGPDDDTMRIELHYLLSAYLYARYPSHEDSVWTNSAHPIQPARLPRRTIQIPAVVFPALANGRMEIQ